MNESCWRLEQESMGSTVIMNETGSDRSRYEHSGSVKDVTYLRKKQKKDEDGAARPSFPLTHIRAACNEITSIYDFFFILAQRNVISPMT